MHDTPPPPPGGTPLYGIYRCVQPQRVCFSAVLVINRVSILADFGHLGHKKGIVLPSCLDMGNFFKKPPFHHYRRENQQKPFTNYVYGNFWSELGIETCYNAGQKQCFDLREKS